MIITTNHGPVRELRMNRPPANALSPELICALKQAIENAPHDGAGALVLSGLPGMFSAGLDVPLLMTIDRPGIAQVWRDFYALLRTLACSPIPIAAAINGHGPAGGTVLALFCDWRGMAEGDWKMGFNEVQVGIPLPPVILAAMQRQVGSRQAERLGAGGLVISAAEAARLGLVDELVPLKRVVDRAVEWCQSLLKLPRQAMAETRRRARADLASLFDDVEPELAQVIESWWSDEAQTVLQALAAKLNKKRST
ncbi:MAG TPA: enoyl-CoA hydratase/isomerase family protein [Terriglobales bacterium]|jgi:enoyl-CoA hydratase/carnithine racemase|nr:enoyl-CoA hydratase/isomerase family protein [Terriglobales bacterium]